MKRSYGIALACFVLTLLVVGGLFVLPTVQLKSGLDDMIAHLPKGVAFTYGKAKYSIFTHTVTLENAALRFQQDGITIDADKVRVQGGNDGLRQAIETARAAPDPANALETLIAHRIVVKNVHTVMSPIDLHLDRGELDNPRISFHQLFAPMAPIRGPGSGIGGFDALMQRAAVVVTSSAYDHASLDNAAILGTDAGTGDSATMKIASLVIDRFSHGDAGDTKLDGLAIGSGDVTLTVDRIAAGDANHHDFWRALRDGAPADMAAEKFQGASQAIEGLKVMNAGVQTAAAQDVSFTRLGYHNGALTSLTLSVRSLVLDPAALPSPLVADLAPKLGYPSLKLDGSLSFDWAQDTGVIRVAPVRIVMDQGGTLAIEAAIANATATTKIGALKLAQLSARYDDSGLFTRWVAYVSDETKRPVRVVESAYADWLQQQKPAFRRDPPLAAALDGLTAFVRNPRTLLVTMSPAQPVGLADFDPVHPESFTTKLNLKVSAPGPAPAAPAAATPSKGVAFPPRQ